jgi:hypothetical protein
VDARPLPAIAGVGRAQGRGGLSVPGVWALTASSRSRGGPFVVGVTGRIFIFESISVVYVSFLLRKIRLVAYKDMYFRNIPYRDLP